MKFIQQFWGAKTAAFNILSRETDEKLFVSKLNKFHDFSNSFFIDSFSIFAFAPSVYCLNSQ